MKLSRNSLVIAVLAILVLAGMAAAFQQLSVGLAATALHEPVVWGLYVVCFVYFAGLGAGALTVASAALCSGRDEYRSIAWSASLVSLVSLLLAGLFITIDLGRPERALFLVLKGRFQSPLIWDFAIINAMLALAAVYTVVVVLSEVLAPGRRAGGRLARLLAFGKQPGTLTGLPKAVRLLAGAMVVGVPVLYLLTARVFTSLRARPAWNTTGLAPIFLVSALLSGLAAVAIVTSLSREFRQTTSEGQSRRLMADGLVLLIAVDIVLVLSPFITMRQFGTAPPAGVLSPLHGAAVLELAFGLLAPLLMLAATRRKQRPWSVVPGILILLGVFIKRWHIIIPAMLERNLPLPDASYVPNVVECAVSVGLVALGVLLVYLAMRFVTRLGARPALTSQPEMSASMPYPY